MQSASTTIYSTLQSQMMKLRCTQAQIPNKISEFLHQTIENLHWELWRIYTFPKRIPTRQARCFFWCISRRMLTILAMTQNSMDDQWQNDTPNLNRFWEPPQPTKSHETAPRYYFSQEEEFVAIENIKGRRRLWRERFEEVPRPGQFAETILWPHGSNSLLQLAIEYFNAQTNAIFFAFAQS